MGKLKTRKVMLSTLQAHVRIALDSQLPFHATWEKKDGSIRGANILVYCMSKVDDNGNIKVSNLDIHSGKDSHANGSTSPFTLINWNNFIAIQYKNYEGEEIKYILK